MREVISKKGWIEVTEEADWQLCWTDTSVGLERLLRLKKTQKINHFSGMLEICRKKSLCRNISNMAKKCPQDYNFVPKSFLLPEGLDDLISYLNTKNRKGKKPTTFILKPDNGCQGKGIRLLQTSKDVYNAVEYCENAKAVVQHYIHRPFLINNLKFDLRVYALVTCCDPLRIFLYDEGLVRFCTEKYEPPRQDNLGIACMHLTNYAVNKHNVNFDATNSNSDSLEGSKWSLNSLKEWMESNGQDWGKIWEDIGDMVVKTVTSVQPILSYFYQSAFPIDNDGLSCFEILGLDVMLDHKCKPWLIEVNHSPSFNTDTELDLDVKEGLISDCINLIQLSASRIKRAKAEDKKACKERLYSSRSFSARKITREEAKDKRIEAMASHEKYENKYKGRFTRIFPTENEEKQKKFTDLNTIANQNFKESFLFKIESTLEKFKLSGMEKNAAKEAKEAAKNPALRKKKLKQKQKLDNLSSSLPTKNGFSRLHKTLRKERSLLSNGERGSKRDISQPNARVINNPPVNLISDDSRSEYIDVVQRTGRQETLRHSIDYSFSGYRSRSNSIDRAFKDFPQFRDITPNSLYKTMGYNVNGGEKAAPAEPPQHQQQQQYINRKNENLIYRDDFNLKYGNGNGNSVLPKQQAAYNVKFPKDKAMLNLSILGQRL